MDVVIYARYSSKNQSELSIEGQVRECTSYADKLGYTIVENYIDRALSGTNDEREALQKMMLDAKEHSFDAVLVYKFNRFFRDRTEAAIYRKELGKNNVKLISISEAVPEGRGGIFYQAILEAEAEAYSVGLSEDVRRGMYDAARKCQSTGCLPFGLKSDKNKNIIIVEKEALTIRTIFRLYLDGFTSTSIAATLNLEGAKTRQNNFFSSPYICSLLKNEKYIGHYIYKDELISKNGLPRIVTDEDFYKVQGKFKKRHSQHVISKEEKYLLSSLLICENCKGHYTGDSSYSRNKKLYRYYSCVNKRKAKKCISKSIPKKDIEDWVIHKLLSDFSFSQIEMLITNIIDNRHILQMRKSLKRVNKEIKNISIAIKKGIISETTAKLLMEAENEKKILEKELIKISPALIEHKEAKYLAGQFLFDLKNDDNDNYMFRKLLISTCVKNVLVEKNQKISIIYR